MPKCDKCNKEIQDRKDSAMTYKHGNGHGLTGFVCGACEAERRYRLESRSVKITILSTLLEEESAEKAKEMEYGRT